MSREVYRFCPLCGAELVKRICFGKEREVCLQCDWIHFEDPKVAVAVVIQSEGRVLLVQRGNEPQRGCWTLPAGFVDAHEDLKTACQRECLEETGLEIEVDDLLDVISGREHPRGSDLLIVYRGHIKSGSLKAGDDAEAAAFFDGSHLPPLAFLTTQTILHNL